MYCAILQKPQTSHRFILTGWTVLQMAVGAIVNNYLVATDASVLLMLQKRTRKNVSRSADKIMWDFEDPTVRLHQSHSQHKCSHLGFFSLKPLRRIGKAFYKQSKSVRTGVIFLRSQKAPKSLAIAGRSQARSRQRRATGF